MTVLRIDNDDGSCRLEIPGTNRRWSLILLRVPSFNGFSAYVTPQGGKLDANTPKTSVSDISDLISVRDFIDENHRTTQSRTNQWQKNKPTLKSSNARTTYP